MLSYHPRIPSPLPSIGEASINKNDRLGLTPKELEKIFDAVADQAHVGVKRVSAQQEKAAWLRRGSSAVEAVAGIGEMVIQEQAAAKLQAAARGGGQRKGAGKKN